MPAVALASRNRVKMVFAVAPRKFFSSAHCFALDWSIIAASASSVRSAALRRGPTASISIRFSMTAATSARLVRTFSNPFAAGLEIIRKYL
jgi:hypothetical protein